MENLVRIPTVQWKEEINTLPVPLPSVHHQPRIFKMEFRERSESRTPCHALPSIINDLLNDIEISSSFLIRHD